MAKHTICGTDIKTLEFPDSFSHECYLEEEQALNAKWVKLLAEYKDPLNTPIRTEVKE